MSWRQIPVIAMGVALAGASMELPSSFVVYSEPVKLRYAQVHNKMQSLMRLPEEVVARYADGSKNMALTGFDLDIVRIAQDGTETKVKLDDHYLHHYILYMGRDESMRKVVDVARQDKMVARMLSGCHGMTGMGLKHVQAALRTQGLSKDLKVFGSAAGAEYRDNPQRFEAPFRVVFERPEVWTPTLHVINIQGYAGTLPYSPLLECPCTPQRKISVANHTIDGKAPDPPIHCSAEFAATGNPSCSLATYVGGWRCCEHEVFLVDTDKECGDPQCSEKPIDDVVVKFTFYYEDATPSTRDLESAACCDVTGVSQGTENIEYDVPQCAPGTKPAECVHVVESVQPLGFYKGSKRSVGDNHAGSDLVDLAFAAPHLHVAGLSIALIDDITNQTLCEVHATPDNTGGIAYGHGSEPGNEKGYMVGLSTCRWGGKAAQRFRRDHPMRTRAVYNSTMSHTGVMSLWLMSVSPVDKPGFVV